MKKIFPILFLIFFVSRFAIAQSSDKKVFEEGVQYVHAGNYTKALQLFESISNAYKEQHAEVLYYVVLSYVKIGALNNADVAIRNYKYEIKTPRKEKKFSEINAFLNTALEQFNNNLAQAGSLVDAGKYREALALVDKAIALDSFYAEAYLKRAYINLDLEDYNAVIVDCDNALALRKNYSYAYGYKGTAYYYLKNYSLAIENYSEAIAIKPEENVYNQRAHTFYSMKMYDLAMQDLETVLKLNVQNAYAYYLRSGIYMHQQDYGAALKDLDKAVALGYTDKQIPLYKGECLFFLKKNSLAMENIEEAIRLNDQNAYGYFYKARCFLALHDYYNKDTHVAAIKLYDQAIILDSLNPEFYYFRGISKKMYRTYDAAIEDLNKAIQLDKLNWSFYQERNTCHELKGSFYRIRKKDLYEAIHVYKDDVNQKRETDNESYLYMAESYDLLNDFLKDQAYTDTSFQILNAFIKNNPKNAEAYIQRGKLYYFARADYNNAIEDYSTALKYDSTQYHLYLSLGWAYMAADKPAAAYETFTYVKQRFPETDKVIVDQYIEDARRKMNKK